MASGKVFGSISASNINPKIAVNIAGGEFKSELPVDFLDDNAAMLVSDDGAVQVMDEPDAMRSASASVEKDGVIAYYATVEGAQAANPDAQVVVLLWKRVDKISFDSFDFRFFCK